MTSGLYMKWQQHYSHLIWQPCWYFRVLKED